MKIAVAAISPDPAQPRKLFDVEKLQELARSLKENGQLQDITVRPDPDNEGRFFVCYGERRWREHQLLVDQGVFAFKTISAKVVEIADKDQRVRQIVENVARADMTAQEEATSFAALLDSMPEEEAARRLGLSLAKFRARVSLTKLEPGIWKLLGAKQIKDTDAAELARLPRHADQLKLLKMLNAGQLGRWNSLKAAVDAILQPEETQSLFGADAPAATNEEVRALSVMEQRISRVAGLLSGGFKDGEIVIANKVSPDRAAHLADLLGTIRVTARQMETALRAKTAQARLAVE